MWSPSNAYGSGFPVVLVWLMLQELVLSPLTGKDKPLTL